MRCLSWELVNGRNVEKLKKVEDQIIEQGGIVASFCCDISNPISSRKLLYFTIKKFGKLDVLINNAGVGFPSKLEELSIKDYEKMFSRKI